MIGNDGMAAHKKMINRIPQAPGSSAAVQARWFGGAAIISILTSFASYIWASSSLDESGQVAATVALGGVVTLICLAAAFGARSTIRRVWLESELGYATVGAPINVIRIDHRSGFEMSDEMSRREILAAAGLSPREARSTRPVLSAAEVRRHITATEGRMRQPEGVRQRVARAASRYRIGSGSAKANVLAAVSIGAGMVSLAVTFGTDNRITIFVAATLSTLLISAGVVWLALVVFTSAAPIRRSCLALEHEHVWNVKLLRDSPVALRADPANHSPHASRQALSRVLTMCLTGSAIELWGGRSRTPTLLARVEKPNISTVQLGSDRDPESTYPHLAIEVRAAELGVAASVLFTVARSYRLPILAGGLTGTGLVAVERTIEAWLRDPAPSQLSTT